MGMSGSEMSRRLEEIFTNLAGSSYEISGQASKEYNCIAWVMRISTQNWDCNDPDGYWPPSILRDDSIMTIMQLFASQGFSLCEDDTPEPGYEKIALYAFVGRFTHAARQLEDGHWTSKLGKGPTITHNSPANLTGGFYGNVHCIMRRPVPP